MTLSRVAIVGSGLIGRAWAISFARAGHEVALWDENLAAPREALKYIEGVLPDLEANDLLAGASAPTVAGRIFPVADLGVALKGAVHAQECAPEDVEVKTRLFARLDQLAESGAVLASSTSAILPSAFTASLKGRERCLVAHPLNPPYLIPAVEIVPAPWTEAAIVERTATLLSHAGHAPIVMKREIDGFLMNRLQGALLEEAFRLVEGGFASVEDVDVGVRDGLALRWSFMGPFETIDLNAPGGVRDYARRYERIYAAIFPSTQRRVEWGGPVMEIVEAERRASLPAGEVAARQAWRDRRLMALAAHKRDAGERIGR